MTKWNCHCCRKPNEIVLFVQGMRYCEAGKHKAPRSRREFKQYTRTNAKDLQQDWRHRGGNKLELVK